jgi:hypothetical protein
VLNKPLDILIFGLQFPEPKSTAAGSRMLQLINLFQDYEYNIHFACSQPKTNFSTSFNQKSVSEHVIRLNDNSVKKLLEKIHPRIVIFDRFITEEQFGWIVDETCPHALKILDTEDLHFLRENREAVVKKSITESDLYTLTDKAKREIAAIYRCDLTLMISKIEIDILVQKFNVPIDLLVYLPFILKINKQKYSQLPNYESRLHFMSIGNFKHSPNLDMVKNLHQHIWPKIKHELPKVEWHIYGAYVPKQIEELHNPKQGVMVKGRAEEAIETLQKYKVMLAPIRFGAGLKGKCIDSFQAGIPSITTKIGAEGIAGAKMWSGFVKDEIEEFFESAVQLYQDESLWKDKQEMGFDVLEQNFDVKIYKHKFKNKIEDSLDALSNIRNQNIVGKLLKHHLHRSTKFMSLWIEEKNKN